VIFFELHGVVLVTRMCVVDDGKKLVCSSETESLVNPAAYVPAAYAQDKRAAYVHP
tara:strand:+ start:705 stop:872 length:168 start_codon:yes stop_codon:yes gene_type:complete